MNWLNWSKWERKITIQNIIVGILLAFLIGILVWGLIVDQPNIDPKSLKELIEDTGKTFGD